MKVGAPVLYSNSLWCRADRNWVQRLAKLVERNSWAETEQRRKRFKFAIFIAAYFIKLSLFIGMIRFVEFRNGLMHNDRVFL